MLCYICGVQTRSGRLAGLIIELIQGVSYGIDKVGHDVVALH